MTALAHHSMLGRETDSPEHPKPAEYVANRAARPAWYPTSAFHPERTGSH